MNNQTKLKLDRPDFSELTTAQRAEVEYECTRLEMIANTFSKLFDPWDEVEVFGDWISFSIEICPMDMIAYLKLNNTGHMIEYNESIMHVGFNYILITPDRTNSRRYFESVDRIVDYFIRSEKESIAYYVDRQLMLAA